MANSIEPRGKSVAFLGRNGGRQHTPHSSDELSKATNEAGHTDDSIRDGDTASLDVEHGEDESGGGEGEETTVEINQSANLTHVKQAGVGHSQGAGVADFPQRGRALDIGVGRERTVSPAGAVVNAIRIGERTLVVSEVVHGSQG